MSTTGGADTTTDPSQRAGMPGTIGLGHIGGVRVRAHWSVLIVTALIWVMLSAQQLPAYLPGQPTWQYVLVGAVAAVMFLAGLLAHEIAHAVVARKNGVQVGTVTLWMLGGVTELKSEAQTPGAELRIAGAGPLTSFLLGVLAGGLAALAAALHWSEVAVAALAWLAVVNVGLALFNVLPGAPLDGGRLLRATLWKLRGDRVWASIAAARCGRALGVLLLVLGGVQFVRFHGDVSGLWLAMVGWFVMGSARTEEQQAQLQKELSGVRVRDVMTPSPDAASPDLTVAQFLDAYPSAYRHSTVPLVEDGRPVGLVSLDAVRAVPAAVRSATTLGAIARPMSEVPVAAPDESVSELLPRLDSAADRRALVIDDGLLVGIVSPADVTRAVEYRRTGWWTAAASRS